MQAVILAAGLGRRLGELTSHNTKCMLEVNGTRLIDRMLSQLHDLDLSRIIIVTGHEGANLRNYLNDRYPGNDIIFIDNPVYATSNNIYSLWLTREYLYEDDTLLLESDLIFEDAVLKLALESSCPTLALVSKYETWNDGTMVTLDNDNNIVNFVPKKAFNYADTTHYYKTLNIYKFSRDFLVNHYLPFLEAYIKVLGDNEYYEQVLRVITLIDRSDMKAVPVNGLKWYEIDDVQDLRIAETIFAAPEERLAKLQHSFGGYWRYPALTDFCYLVNPFFPPQKMVDEMKANFDALLRDYPSGMGVNTLLAGKYFGVRQEYMCIGNGAAELIRSLMNHTDGRVGVIYPTFEEYPNRLDPDQLVVYRPANQDFSYTADDLMDYFSDKKLNALLLVNPDNPSGNFIPRHDLMRLVDYCRDRSIRLLVDESFVDFADGDDPKMHTLLENSILEANPHLCVMKSISKSYGVPGVRLGVLATSDRAMVDTIRHDVPIWNINSFGEFYMQIFGKYENYYYTACRKFRETRDEFGRRLAEIKGLRVIPSQANYFLAELTSGHTSHDIALQLLEHYNILIKDCSGKKGFPAGSQYVRIAVRDHADNNRIIEALNSLLNP